MIENLEKLAAIEGFSGLCVHFGEDIVWKNLPKNVTDSAADDLCAMVSKSFTHYESSERLLQQLYIEKAGQCLSVFRLPQDNRPALFLTFFLSARAAVSEITRAVQELSHASTADWTALKGTA